MDSDRVFPVMIHGSSTYEQTPANNLFCFQSEWQSVSCFQGIPCLLRHCCSDTVLLIECYRFCFLFLSCFVNDEK